MWCLIEMLGPVLWWGTGSGSEVTPHFGSLYLVIYEERAEITKPIAVVVWSGQVQGGSMTR